MSKVLVVGIITILIILFGFNFFLNKQTVLKSSLRKNNTPLVAVDTSVTPINEIKASFAIFTNGTFRVFTAAMYHNLSTEVYIEASSPNIIKIKKDRITWHDFFSTLPFKLTSECLTTGTKETFCTGKGGTLQFYLNGVKNNNVLNQKIKDGDKLLVTFGSESEEQIRQQIDKIP